MPKLIKSRFGKKSKISSHPSQYWNDVSLFAINAVVKTCWLRHNSTKGFANIGYKLLRFRFVSSLVKENLQKHKLKCSSWCKPGRQADVTILEDIVRDRCSSASPGSCSDGWLACKRLMTYMCKELETRVTMVQTIMLELKQNGGILASVRGIWGHSENVIFPSNVLSFYSHHFIQSLKTEKLIRNMSLIKHWCIGNFTIKKE